MNLCWVIPKNAPAGKRDVQFTDKLELEDGGYAEFRIVVGEGETRQEATVYVQDSRRTLSAVDWDKAAWGLFGAHGEVQVFHLDGSTVER